MEMPGGIIKGGIKLIAFSKRLKGFEWSQEFIWASRENHPHSEKKREKKKKRARERKKKTWNIMAHTSHILGAKLQAEGSERLIDWKGGGSI